MPILMRNMELSGLVISQAQQLRHFPNAQVFSCLSQDMIAHELTHGLLMGMDLKRRAKMKMKQMGTIMRSTRRLAIWSHCFCISNVPMYCALRLLSFKAV